MDFNLWGLAPCALPHNHDGPHNDLNETIWVDIDYDRWQRMNSIVTQIIAIHRSKETWSAHDDAFVLICDYDKTEWPCKTRQILESENAV